MSNFIELLQFCLMHSSEFFEIVFAVVSVASLITALTPTPRDDEMVGRIYRIIEAVALNVGHAKDTPPNRKRDTLS